MNRPHWRQSVIATVIGVVLTAIMTYPTIVHPGSFARTDSNDGMFSIWNVAWVAHAFVDDPANLFNANIFHPHRGTLAYSEANLVAGAMGAPVYALTRDPVATHNVVVYLSLVAAFLATWCLVRRLTGSWTAALVSATGFAFSAYVSAHTAHIQLLLVFVVPLSLIALHRFVERPGAARGVALGASLALAGLACAYYGIMMGLAIGFGALWFAPGQPRPRRYWLGLALAVVVGGAAVAPAIAPYATLRRDEGFRSTINVEEARGWSADHRAYMRGHSGPLTALLPRRLHVPLDTYVGTKGEVLFPGVLIALLAVLGLATVRVSRAPSAVTGAAGLRVLAFYVLLTLLAAWASLGPDAGLYTWLGQVVPFMSFLRAPARFGVLVLFGLALLAGVGLAHLERVRRLAWVSAALMVLTAVELKATWPLREVPPVPAAYRTLAGLPRAAVLVLQFPYKPGEFFPHAEYMFWSMWHWQPLVNGYSDFIPADIQRIAVPLNGFPDPESFRLLRERGVRYVAIDWRRYNDAASAVMRDRIPAYRQYLRVLVDTDPVWLYEIVAWPE